MDTFSKDKKKMQTLSMEEEKDKKEKEERSHHIVLSDLSLEQRSFLAVNYSKKFEISWWAL